MISIIVCSKDEDPFKCFSESVSQTIGVPYEIVRIDNNKNDYSICKAYNEGASKAKYDILCFSHEDIFHKTDNWGSITINYFHQLHNAGVIGILGSVYKAKALSGWLQRTYPNFEPNRCRLMQYFKYNTHLPPTYVYVNPLNENYAEVISLDGLFLCMKMEIWKQYPFDEKLLQGFHGYDLDICLSVSTAKKNYVVFNILVEHLSEGKQDESWIKENLKVHQKHQHRLPLSVSNFTHHVDADFQQLDNRGWNNYWLNEMIKQKVSFTKIVHYYRDMLLLTEKHASTTANYQWKWIFKYYLHRKYTYYQSLLSSLFKY